MPGFLVFWRKASLSPGACSNPCLLSWWCHPTISSSAALFTSCSQPLPASGSFLTSQSTLCISWPKYWSLSFSINPSNEYSGLISFWIDWFDFLAFMDCSPPGSSVCGIFQAKILGWVVISSSKGSYWPRNWTSIFCVSCIAGRFFTFWAIREGPHYH